MKKDTDLITALKKAIKKKSRSAYDDAVKQERYKNTGYDIRHDAYYKLDTGEWVEKVCGNKDCYFCSKRPKKHYGKRKEKR